MEQWKTVSEFENYEVSDQGRVRRSAPGPHTYAGKVLRPNKLNKGYLQVGLYKNGKIYPRLVHVLVAKEFIPNPKGLPQVNHLGSNDDCRATRLEWRTEAGNQQHAVKTGRKAGNGVSYTKKTKKWRAGYCPKPNVRVYLGEFDTKQEALSARARALFSLAPIL